MSHFHGPLVYEDSPRAGYYILLAALMYSSDAANLTITAPRGSETNFVTGRKLLVVRRIVQDKMNPAAVIHDMLYSDGMLSRRLADEVFREAMLECGVAWWRAWAAWAAVRTFGGQFYKGQESNQHFGT